jgi:hypothetical protein
MTKRLLVLAALLCAGELLAQPVLRVAYFIPNDRQPCADFTNRLDAVVKEVQAFYRKGMEANGHGPISFTPDRNADGSLNILLVHGKYPLQQYGRNDSGKVRSEVKAELLKAGINMDRETVLLFQVLLEWQGDKATEVGPYCGGGDHRSGTAWVYDDERLDARRLGDLSKGGYYHGYCSIGKFNSHYVGGVAHELGHALGLPHEREAKNDPRGKSLMGGGNHTYGQEKRKEGRGSFLSAASALPLSSHPLFTGNRSNIEAVCSSKLIDLNASFKDNTFILTGRLTVKPTARGIAAYNDWETIKDNYDALGLTSAIDKDGAFRFAIPELQPGKWALRLRVCHENGGRSSFAFNYTVDPQGKPDLSPFRERWQLSEAARARAAGDLRAVEAIASALAASAPSNSITARKVAHLRRLLKPASPLKLSEIPVSTKRVSVSDLVFTSATTGWGAPLRNEVLPEEGQSCLLEIDGQFLEKGLYAHAPACHTLDLAKGWKRLQSCFGVQDGHPGSVVFVVKGDGKELFRSSLIKERTVQSLDVDVTGISKLELLTENGNDGANGDWGVWLVPTLQR